MSCSQVISCDRCGGEYSYDLSNEAGVTFDTELQKFLPVTWLPLPAHPLRWMQEEGYVFGSLPKRGPGLSG